QGCCFAQDPGIDFCICLVRLDLQRAMQRDVVQLYRVFISVNMDRASGGINGDWGFIAFNADIALNGSYLDIGLIALQRYVNLARHADFQLNRSGIVMTWPTEDAILLRVFHFKRNLITVIVEIGLYVFHPPFAVSIIAFKPLDYVNHYLITV